MGLYDFWYLDPIYGGYENISIAKTFKVLYRIINYVMFIGLISNRKISKFSRIQLLVAT